eukprot:comp22207_c0_seq1/m.32670 comp22207_c0_seq1/g.32670  ORF comp22207_c0_seq1/g.32670 comp22207_c0_seq1/m.32670 type:complete len:444 (-) comp22207_c0_seq1:813-2144(-)
MTGDSELSFSFAGAGWLKMYYFGVAHAFQQYGVHKHARFAGSSAGALVSCALVLDCDMLEVRDIALACLEDCHKSYSNAFRLKKYVTDVVDSQLGEERFLKRRQELEDRLEIAVTILPGCHSVRYKKFGDYENFKNMLMASCCATPICGFPFKLDGQWVFDGGLADFQPLIDENTITVSPFYFHRADIKPSQYVPAQWAAYPGTREEFERLFQLGYDDAEAWLAANGVMAPASYRPPAWATRRRSLPMPRRMSMGREGTPLAHGPHNHHGHTHHVHTSKGTHTLSEEEERTLSRELQLGADTIHHMALHHHRSRDDPLPNDESTYWQAGPGHIQERRTWFSTCVEIWFLMFMFCVVKPASYLLLYTELWVMTGVAFWRALLHDVLPTFSRRTRKGAWMRFGHYVRSLVSFHLLARALVGPSVEINRKRLFEQSLVFRVMVFVM